MTTERDKFKGLLNELLSDSEMLGWEENERVSDRISKKVTKNTKALIKAYDHLNKKDDIVIALQKKLEGLVHENEELKKEVKRLRELSQPTSLTKDDKRRILKELYEDDY